MHCITYMNRNQIVITLIKKLQELLVTLQKQYAATLTPTMKADKLIEAAKESLGQELWRGTGVDPAYACAISVNAVHTKAFGFPIGGQASTAALYQALLKNIRFEFTTESTPGAIVISPTGTGHNPQYPNGHVGIICNYGICSNDSDTGRWSENYKDIDDWRHQFTHIEGYPTYIFKLK